MKRVIIYEDPLTMEKPGEEAILLEKVFQNAELHRWLVRYDDGSEMERWINPIQLVMVDA
jgi:hypothetical protein